MRLSLATNFDNHLLEAVRDFSVREVFGKLPADAIGGGRSSYMLAATSRCRLIEHIRQAHWNGIEFNYLINAACLGSREFTRKGQKDIRRLLDWLSHIGVDWVTVSTPYLLELVKAKYPHFKVKVGVFAEVNSPSSARHWEDMGADRITLPPITLNRNFEQLKKIRDSVQCDLELLVNHTCLLDCPFREYHKLLLSHSSQQGHPGKFLIDYCLLKCTSIRIADPVHYIRSPWIRPEDIHIYESLGFSSFKVLERGAPTEALISRVHAYYERRYDGNLLDIIQPFGFKESKSKTQPGKPWLWDLRAFVRPWKANPVRLLKWREFAREQGMLYKLDDRHSPVYIDNNRLKGFLQNFPKGGCTSRDCGKCGYCDGYALSALNIDPGFQHRSQHLAKENLDYFMDGSFWKGSAVKLL